MKIFILASAFCAFSAVASNLFFAPEDFWLDDHRYPTHPVEQVTPGSLCGKANTYRYPERIPYCERNVDKSLKEAIIREYDERFGFQIQKINRLEFKIDHYIPLCMGGSNERDNLWPQHRSIYDSTDLIEQRTCELMAKGRLLQNEAVRLIKQVKNNLEQAPEVLSDLNRKLRE